jgi:hypothetical protein
MLPETLTRSFPRLSVLLAFASCGGALSSSASNDASDAAEPSAVSCPGNRDEGWCPERQPDGGCAFWEQAESKCEWSGCREPRFSSCVDYNIVSCGIDEGNTWYFDSDSGLLVAETAWNAESDAAESCIYGPHSFVLPDLANCSGGVFCIDAGSVE